MNDASAHGQPIDGLLTPSVTHEPLPSPAPYRVHSAFYVGFFGGPFAALLVHAVNAGRLRLQPAARRRVLVEGAAACAVLVAGLVVLLRTYDLPSVRLPVAVAGVLTHLLLARHLGARERHWQMRGVAPASLWGFGIVSVLGGGLVLGVLLAALGATR